MSPPLTSWSFSRWDKHNTCPFQFKLAVLDKMPTHRGPAMERGDKIHKAIAAHLQQPLTNVAPEVAFNGSVIEELNGFNDKLIEQQWGFTNQWTPTGWFGKDTWLRSIIDVGVLYEDHTSEVIDWKTGKVRGTHEDQMELFAVSVMCHAPFVTHVTTRLVYLDAEEQEIAEFPAADREKLISKWERKIAPMFEDTSYLPRPGDQCRFCDFSRSKGGQCRFG